MFEYFTFTTEKTATKALTRKIEQERGVSIIDTDNEKFHIIIYPDRDIDIREIVGNA